MVLAALEMLQVVLAACSVGDASGVVCLFAGDDIYMMAAQQQSGGAEDAPPSLMQQLGSTVRSLTTFMRQLSQ